MYYIYIYIYIYIYLFIYLFIKLDLDIMDDNNKLILSVTQIPRQHK